MIVHYFNEHSRFIFRTIYHCMLTPKTNKQTKNRLLLLSSLSLPLSEMSPLTSIIGLHELLNIITKSQHSYLCIVLIIFNHLINSKIKPTSILVEFPVVLRNALCSLKRMFSNSFSFNRNFQYFTHQRSPKWLPQNPHSGFQSCLRCL